MTTAKKGLFKTCGNPKCKFKKCWINAPKCEECGWDFKLQRMPRGVKAADIQIDIDDDDDIPLPPETPKQTTKPCPECGHKCWHAAPICENCSYDFVNKLSKRQKEEKESRKRKHHEDEPEQPKKAERTPLGARPRFSLIEREPWMDDYDGDPNNLRAWANNFLRKLREKFSVHLFAGCIVEWAEEWSKNAKLRDPKTVSQLADWYAVKKGVVTWKPHPHSKMLENGFILTDEEAQTVIRQTLHSWNLKVSVEQVGKMPDGREFTYFTMMSLEEAEKHRAASKKINYIMLVGFGGMRSMAVLPPDWAKKSQDARIAWFYARGCSPVEGMPTGDMVKREKVKK